MGRVKSLQIKKAAIKLFETRKKSFTDNFEQNKKAVDNLLETSKKIRNSIAGYITRLVKKDLKENQAKTIPKKSE